MARHSYHSAELNRQLAQDHPAGEALHSLARLYDLSRNLIRVWSQKFEIGSLSDEAVAA